MAFLAQTAEISRDFIAAQLGTEWTTEAFAAADYAQIQDAFVRGVDEAIDLANAVFASLDGTPVMYDDEVSGITVSGKLFKCESYNPLTNKFQMLLNNGELEAMPGKPKMAVAFGPDELLDSYRRTQVAD